jgi:tetratricopeptide (TPR) repeat protein
VSQRKNQFEAFVQECDAYIRAGKPHLAGHRLTSLGRTPIPRVWRLPLAKLCRRAGLYGQGLRLLGRVVCGPTARASAAELTEYAALLLRSGAVDEAIDRLKTVDPAEAPEAQLIRAFAHFYRWEYREAVPHLEKYLQSPLSNDAILVGRTNLATAYLDSRQHRLAEEWISGNIEMARSHGHTHLETYNRASLAQLRLQEGDLASARMAIAAAFQAVGDTQANSNWLILKLKLIIDGLEEKTLSPFDELRRLAVEKKDWAALRDADLFSLKIDFRQQNFLHLYFGSPLPGQREHFCQELGRRPDRKIYIFGKKTVPRFDLDTGRLDDKNLIHAGHKCHNLIRLLLQDFYQPLRIGGLHAGLFPGQHFDSSSSPDRVHQIVRRTRRWLDDNNIPVRIQEDEGFYSLVIDGDFSFRVPLDRPVKDAAHFQLDKLMAAFADGRIFSAQEIQGHLQTSLATVHRLIQQGIENGVIERIGNPFRPTGYRFLNVSNRSAA